MDFFPNKIATDGMVKIRIEAVGGDLDRVACRYPASFMDEMARQITAAIEAATGTVGVADSSVELIMMFASGTYMEHISGNITYRRLMLIDKVSAPRDFWVKWTRLQAVEGEYNSDNILFEIGEDVDQKIREKEYRYLLQSGGEKYHNSMSRKKVTEWRDIIRRAAKRGELSKTEIDFELAPETLELEERIADLLGKRIAARDENEREEVPFVHSDESEFAQAMAKMRMVVDGAEENYGEANEASKYDALIEEIEKLNIESEPEEALVIEEELAKDELIIEDEIADEPEADAEAIPEVVDIFFDAECGEEIVDEFYEGRELVIEEIRNEDEEEPEVEEVVEEPEIEVEEIRNLEFEIRNEEVEEIRNEEFGIRNEEVEEIWNEEFEIRNEDEEEPEVEEVVEEPEIEVEEIRNEEFEIRNEEFEIRNEDEEEPEVEEVVEEPEIEVEEIRNEEFEIQNEDEEDPLKVEAVSIADRVADIRAELEIKIRLEYETRAREKAEAELIELRRALQKLQIQSDETIAALTMENERLNREYNYLVSQVENERRAREAEAARLRLEEQQLRRQIESQLRAEAAEKERLAEAARMAIDEQRRLEAENARIARQREEEERLEAERLRAEEHERELEAIRQAELERIRREDEEARERAKNAMPEMGDGRYAYTSKTVKLLFRKSVDPNITTRIQEIIKATVDYYGKDGVYLRIKASLPDTQTVVLEFIQIPIEEMALLGNIIKIIGNSGLGVAKAIIE